MPWDGAGNFTRTDGTRTGSQTWTEAEAASVDILSADHDVHDQDLADGIEACLALNGENSPTGAINWGGQDLTNLGDVYLNGNKLYIGSDADDYLEEATAGKVDLYVESERILRIDNSGTTPEFSVRDNATDANIGPIFTLLRDSASPADADNLGAIKFNGKDDAGNETTFAQIKGAIIDASDTTEDGAIIFSPVVAASITELARVIGAALLVGKQLDDSGATAGVQLMSTGSIHATRDGNFCLNCNRLTDDGTLINFQRDGSSVGNITVTSGVVALTAFTGAHWSQFEDPAQDLPPVGTVLSTVDVPFEREESPMPQLVKCKITDTQADPRVYGAFAGMSEAGYVISWGLGTVRVRVIGAVAGGELIQSSAMPGVAERQPDQSAIGPHTLGKLSMGDNRTDERLLPAVLYCG